VVKRRRTGACGHRRMSERSDSDRRPVSAMRPSPTELTRPTIPRWGRTRQIKRGGASRSAKRNLQVRPLVISSYWNPFSKKGGPKPPLFAKAGSGRGSDKFALCWKGLSIAPLSPVAGADALTDRQEQVVSHLSALSFLGRTAER